jgi:nucleoside-diphosphate-sugar epimerase
MYGERRRVLVTGATGFLGRHLTRTLLVEGESEVGILVRSERGIDDLFGGDRERLRVFLGDLGSEAVLREACRHVDTVFHCAALGPSAYGTQNRPEDYARVNVEGTTLLAREARGAGVGRFVHVSSTGAMGAPPDEIIDEDTDCRPESPYQRSKRDAELRLLEMCRDGFPAVIVRPCLIAGEGKRGGDLVKLFRLCRRGLFPVFDRRLDVEKPLVAVDDAVEAIVLAAAKGRSGEIYLIHSGSRHTLGAILDVAGRLVGNPRPYRNVPLPLAVAASRVTTPVARWIGRSPPLAPERLAMFLSDRRIVIDKARRELGYRPRHQDLEEILGRAYRDFVRTGQLPGQPRIL